MGDFIPQSKNQHERDFALQVELTQALEKGVNPQTDETYLKNVREIEKEYQAKERNDSRDPNYLKNKAATLEKSALARAKEAAGIERVRNEAAEKRQEAADKAAALADKEAAGIERVRTEAVDKRAHDALADTNKSQEAAASVSAADEEFDSLTEEEKDRIYRQAKKNVNSLKYMGVPKDEIKERLKGKYISKVIDEGISQAYLEGGRRSNKKNIRKNKSKKRRGKTNKRKRTKICKK